jgi:hypothetical protein
MAGLLLLVAALCGVVVADLVLENPVAGEATVFTLPVGDHSQGMLLAMAAALGFVVALLLVASASSTHRRRARRKQLRAIRAGRQRQAAAPEPEQAGLLDEWFGRHASAGDLSEPARLAGLGHERSGAGTDDRRVTVTPGPSEHHPGSFHQRTSRAAQLRNQPDGWFAPNHQQRSVMVPVRPPSSTLQWRVIPTPSS